MKIPGKYIFQADDPHLAQSALDAIVHGAKTDFEIGSSIHSNSARTEDAISRDGRYYRLPSEILGFTERLQLNRSSLTDLGRAYGSSTASERNAIFAERALGNTVFSRLISFIQTRGGLGRAHDELASFIESISDLSPETAHRRTSSYLKWLESYDVIQRQGNLILFNGLPPVAPILNIQSVREPILPQRFSLREFEEQAERVSEHKSSIAYFMNQASKERANNSHKLLVNLMASKIRTAGALPTENRFIDLATKFADQDYLFEMKSTTRTNFHSQARKGISQLYEYRYIENLPSAKLVLVLQEPFPPNKEWLNDYILRDRNILLVWDGDNDFHCSAEIAQELPFLR